MIELLSVDDVRSLGGIGEGGGEGIEGAVRRDRELEAIADPSVLDRDGERVLVRMPEQQHLDAVVLAGGEFATPAYCRAHFSSFSCGRWIARVHAATLRARRPENVVPKPDSSSTRVPIRIRTERRFALLLR